jgi:tRNA pseudouridine55 synthase
VTSREVVDQVRRRLRVEHAGHLGTLDPAASGLLLVAIGAATRCACAWQGGEKTYQGTARFGVVTTTQDLTGEVTEKHPVDLEEERVREASRSLLGEIDQVPPMVSALKVHGQRLYRLARRGITVERAPRRVRVAAWEWLEFSFPTADFRVRCSSGTYVRTLVHDLGAALGTGAALAALSRLRSEPFGLEGAVTWRDLELFPPEEIWARAGLEMEEALSGLPSVTLDPGAAAAIGHGARPSISAGPPEGSHDAPEPLTRPHALPVATGSRSVLLLGPEGEALALGELIADPAAEARLLVCPHVVFPWAVRDGRP